MIKTSQDHTLRLCSLLAALNKIHAPNVYIRDAFQSIQRTFEFNSGTKQPWAGPIAIEFQQEESIVSNFCSYAIHHDLQLGAILLTFADIIYWLSFGGCRKDCSDALAIAINQLDPSLDLDFILDILERIGDDLLYYVTWQKNIPTIRTLSSHTVDFLNDEEFFRMLCNQIVTCETPLDILEFISHTFKDGIKTTQWLSVLDWFKTANEICKLFLSNSDLFYLKSKQEYMHIISGGLGRVRK